MNRNHDKINSKAQRQQARENKSQRSNEASIIRDKKLEGPNRPST